MSSESKRRDTAPSSHISPLILSLIRFGTSSDFEADLEVWMEARCAGFEGAGDSKCEQKLEWGATFSEYGEWLDSRLEEFCADEGVTAEAVSESMSEVLQKEGAAGEFFPAFMSCTDYATFLNQMHELAVKADRQADANTALGDVEDSDSSCNISGVWNADPATYDPELAELYLKQLNCPWVFRKPVYSS